MLCCSSFKQNMLISYLSLYKFISSFQQNQLTNQMINFMVQFKDCTEYIILNFKINHIFTYFAHGDVHQFIHTSIGEQTSNKFR